MFKRMAKILSFIAILIVLFFLLVLVTAWV